LTQEDAEGLGKARHRTRARGRHRERKGHTAEDDRKETIDKSDDNKKTPKKKAGAPKAATTKGPKKTKARNAAAPNVFLLMPGQPPMKISMPGTSTAQMGKMLQHSAPKIIEPP